LETSIESHQVIESFERKVLGLDAARECNRCSNLVEIGRTVGTTRQMLFETTALATRERPVEVVTYKLNGVAANERTCLQ
jgi:hypothetical protein